MEALFNFAGLTMGVHLVCSLALLAMLRTDPLATELFALPNAWLGPRPSWLDLHLLRARFFLPWVPSPLAMGECPLATRAVFWLARLSGGIFPLAILAFLVSAFAVSGR
jgi:hypothetical protein